jgi:hypothetical protein
MESEHKNESTKTTGNRFSTRKLLLAVGGVLILVVALGYVLSRNYLAPPSTELAVTFDFDTGNPLLSEGQNLPLNQTSEGITAYFSSPSDTLVASAFSIQSYKTTFITLSQFSGNYLYDNKPSRDTLEIKFSQQLKSISLTFATIEYRAGPNAIKLTAYVNSTDTTPAGSASARGTVLTGLYPQGVLSFDSSGQPFNIVRIEIPSQGSGETTNFFVDNIRVVDAT